jgi:hypothetical protein
VQGSTAVILWIFFTKNPPFRQAPNRKRRLKTPTNRLTSN